MKHARGVAGVSRVIRAQPRARSVRGPAIRVRHAGPCLLLGLLPLLPLIAQHVPPATARAAVIDGLRAKIALPLVAEHRYRMAGRIRPLLPFWVGRDNVGSARIRWHRAGDGAQAYELLIGTDPDRAPRHVNRWGYVREEVRGLSGRIVGVMKQSNEESIDEVKTRLDKESQEGFPFSLIVGTAGEGTSRAHILVERMPRDLGYRDLGTLLERFEAGSASPIVRDAKLPSGVRPGLLAALAELVHQDIDAYRRSGWKARTGRQRTLPYVYAGRFYEVTLQSSKFQNELRAGGRTFAKVITADFRTLNRSAGSRESFTFAYGTDGDLVEIPVFITYQPRWWLRAELILDETQKF
jgi:hypothetical protein